MCGHGTIGTVTMALEHGLVTPREPGVLRLDTPAGRVVAALRADGPLRRAGAADQRRSPTWRCSEVRVDCPELGELVVDIAYGGNFYAIVEPQPNYPRPGRALGRRRSCACRRCCAGALNEVVEVAHPVDPTIRGVIHIQWTGRPRDPRAHARNAVFYGDKAIDRSPAAPAPRRGWRSSRPGAS